MPTTAQQLSSVRHRLQHHHCQISELIDFLRHRPRLTRPDLAYARDRLRRIKCDLKRDYEIGNSERRFAALTPAEQLYFHHVVHQAMVAIESRWNSHPVASQWLQQLEDALCNFSHELSQLDKLKNELQPSK